MKNQYTMTLYRENGSWMILSTDPKVMELFGTDTLPSAFTSQCDSATVVARIKELNPTANVQLRVDY